MNMDLRAVRLDRPLTREESAALASLLPPARRGRLERVRLAEKQAQVLCAYGLVHRIVRERYGWRGFPEMALTSLGKPYFPEYPSVFFSLSHTYGAALAGVSDHPIGVDIEKLRPIPRRLRERLAPGETEEKFFESWVRREAFAKQTGKGLGFPQDAEPDGTVRFSLLQLFPGYAAGVACADVPPGSVLLCTPAELAGFSEERRAL